MYKCPGCGSALAFSIEKQLWSCDFCRNDYSLGDLTARDEAARADSGVRQSAETLGDELQGYHCRSCGAQILAEKNTAATFCAYCRSPAILPTQLGAVRKPDYILPFKIAKERALEMMIKACRARPFLPSAFRRDLRSGVISGLYVPFWLFSCNARGYLEAEADRVTSWSDSRYHYTKTDTYHVVRDADMDIRHVPIDASLKMDDDMMRAIEPFDYAQMEAFALQYLSGHYADSYDLTPEQAIPQGDGRMDTAVRDVMTGMTGGYTSVRRRRLDVYKRNTAMAYAMLPVWTFQYRYKNKDYAFSINGQTGKINGKLPISPGRVTAWLAALLVVIIPLAFLFASGGGMA